MIKEEYIMMSDKTRRRLDWLLIPLVFVGVGSLAVIFREMIKSTNWFCR